MTLATLPMLNAAIEAQLSQLESLTRRLKRLVDPCAIDSTGHAPANEIIPLIHDFHELCGSLCFELAGLSDNDRNREEFTMNKGTVIAGIMGQIGEVVTNPGAPPTLQMWSCDRIRDKAEFYVDLFNRRIEAGVPLDSAQGEEYVMTSEPSREEMEALRYSVQEESRHGMQVVLYEPGVIELIDPADGPDASAPAQT